jgi:hypothetical protein
VQVNQERGTVVLRQEGQSPVMILTMRKEARSVGQRGKLVFQRYGSSFFRLRCGVRPMPSARRLPRAPGKKNWPATSNRSRFSWCKPARILTGAPLRAMQHTG